MNIFRHTKLRSFDWISFFILLTLSGIGLLFVMSTTYQEHAPYSVFFKKQMYGVAIGIMLFFATCCIDYRRMQRWGYFLYFATTALLAFTLIKGSIGLGGQRWINLGFFKFQPSELIKLFFPAFFTYYLIGEKKPTYDMQTFLPVLVTLAISLVLILKQPDLGTAIIIGSSSLLLLAYAGIGRKFFTTLILFVTISAPILWGYLKPYQKQRIAVFLGQGNTQKERYQIEQSFIAIGSGGMKGKGFLQGTQNILQFLPESRTDFIFSITCEEWGFIGALSIILLYAALFIRILYVISTLSDFNAQLLAIGLTAPLWISTIINMGMVTGLVPVVGIPLPFMSYGITHTWITLICMGWYQSIALSRSYHNIRL